MNNNDSTKIVFMFGAGVESSGNFNIRMGFEFLRHSLSPSESLMEALQSHFKNYEYFENTYKYTRNKMDLFDSLLKNLITQKASTNKAFFEKYKNDIFSLLPKERIKHICNELGIDDISYEIDKNGGKNDIATAIKEEFKDVIINKDKYSHIKQNILKEIFLKRDDGGIGYDSNISISGLLDGYFHTIINPKKYSKIRFSKIFNFYWSCYFTVLEDVLNYLSLNGSNEFDSYYKKDDGGKSLDYLKVIENICEITNKLYKVRIEEFTPENSYYNLIKGKLMENKDSLLCEGIITTNYFKFCEIINKNVIYLNGQLKYFEYPECLEVEDISNTNIKKENLIFPFIFAQSLVKPIVSHIQIEEFSKMKKLLDDSNMLIILGFNINEDDNHINAYLHDYVKYKPIIIVTDRESYDAEERLKYKGENIHICKVRYDNNENVVNQVFEFIEKMSLKSEGVYK